MSLTKKDLNEAIQKITQDVDVRIEEANKRQTEQLADVIEGIVESIYSNHPTRGEIKQGLKSFSESVTLKSS